MAELKVVAEISGSVWKILVRPGDRVDEEEPLVLLESMKMEIPVLAPEGGTVVAVNVVEGTVIGEGELIVVMQT